MAVCFGVLATAAESQPEKEKISHADYIEANEFAHMFWEKLVRTKDVEPLLKKFATSDFYRCIDSNSLALIRDDQITPARRPLLKRYYLAEKRFLLLFFLWTGSNVEAGPETDDDPYLALPREVRKIFPRRLWDAMYGEDEPNEQKPLSEREANRYFDRLLRTLEKVDLVFMRLAKKRGAGKGPVFRRNVSTMVDEDKYVFVPELRSGRDVCGLPPGSGPIIVVDVPPPSQLVLTRVEGMLKILKLLFHVD